MEPCVREGDRRPATAKITWSGRGNHGRSATGTRRAGGRRDRTADDGKRRSVAAGGEGDRWRRAGIGDRWGEGDQWQQDCPRHALRPSRAATAASGTAIAGSAHHHPAEFSASPASTPAASRAHRRFCVPPGWPGTARGPCGRRAATRRPAAPARSGRSRRPPGARSTAFGNLSITECRKAGKRQGSTRRQRRALTRPPCRKIDLSSRSSEGNPCRSRPVTSRPCCR